ncbi:hypothetical protein Emin_0275 [Elusimicrobium minutum Pei191]|uniref:Uncharacterized protein n=1 Tax=Elusimicrobium minutum (strain Pei191) TaxID=445932 RepID=B2KBT2_ELUMP|nr:hypothetical protein [Elusimicrobium minutum]ACC97836.1 hypothetical protein Emin_0275 [Elusimicrobium minutum Pei191]
MLSGFVVPLKALLLKFSTPSDEEREKEKQYRRSNKNLKTIQQYMKFKKGEGVNKMLMMEGIIFLSIV